eukprot:752239-Lingulodinium_polyedra.AAC.1
MGGVEVTKDTVLNAVGRLNQRAMEAIAQGHRAYEMTSCDPRPKWPGRDIVSVGRRIALEGPGKTIPCIDLVGVPVLDADDIREILDTCAAFVDWTGVLPTGKAANESARRLWSNSRAKLLAVMAAAAGSTGSLASS